MSKISFAFETDPGDTEGLVVLQNLVSALTGLTKATRTVVDRVENFNAVVDAIKVPENLEKPEVAEPTKVYPDRTENGKFPEPLLKETDEEREARIVANKAAIIKQKPVVQTPAEPVVAKESTSEIKVEDLRALLSKKVEKNRAACKAKLTEMGTTSMTLLDPKLYEEMFNFLSALE